MRRTLLVTGTTVAGVVLLLSLKPHRVPASAAGPGRSSGTAPAPGTPTPRTNGTFTGDTVQTRYGPVQVQITVTSGRLSAVKVLQVPSENGRDREIASVAIPELTREALASGTAGIDTVSGATYTSEGYVRSLQSALDQAPG